MAGRREVRPDGVGAEERMEEGGPGMTRQGRGRGLTWQQEAVVDDGEEVWVGQGVTGLPLQHVKHTLQVGRVHLNLCVEQ